MLETYTDRFRRVFLRTTLGQCGGQQFQGHPTSASFGMRFHGQAARPSKTARIWVRVMPGMPLRKGIEEMMNSENHEPARVRLGAVSYLNSRPLIQDLAELLPGSSIELDYPSRLADALGDKALDIALIPSIEYFRRDGYEIVSNACVAARGAVLSVKLYCRTHPGDVRRIALDEGSRTSATLARVILAEKYGAVPESEPLSMESMTTDSSADAVLLIGDRAMHAPEESFFEVMDLGEMWYQWTGLPFVFAMWVGHVDADLTGVAAALNESRDRGMAAVQQIASKESRRLGITEKVAIEYLTRNLHYTMTSAERSGLQLFHNLASSHHLVNQNANLVFSDFVTA